MEARVLFTRGHYRDPEKAPPSERPAARTVNEWVKRAEPHMPNRKVLVLPLAGLAAIQSKEYDQMRKTLTDDSFPCPVGLSLHHRLVMWCEDPRALPDTMTQALATLRCVELTNRGRLPL